MSDKIQHFVITVRCESGHEQKIGYYGLHRPFVESVAGFMDGTSPMFKYPPGAESAIGKCGICGKQVKATVTDAEEDSKPEEV